MAIQQIVDVDEKKQIVHMFVLYLGPIYENLRCDCNILIVENVFNK